MRYDPKAADMTLPDGVYDAVITAAEEKVSKKGNPMLHVGFKVWGNNRQTVFVHSYFVDNNGGMLAALRQLCNAVGIDFSSGEVRPEQLLNKNLKVELETEPGQGGYGPKNVVAQYLSDTAAPVVTGGVSSDDETECPF